MRKTRFIWLAVIVLSLSACGGGGSSSGESGGAGSGSGPGNNNTAPVANAGVRQDVKTGALVRLDGSASRDADGDRLAYEWTFKSRPSGSGAKLRHAHSATPLFKADAAGVYIARLVVDDGTAYSKPATVKIVATAANINSVPIADAGPSQNVKTSTVVHLDGSSSTESDKQVLTYKWRFVSKAPGSKASLSNANSATPSFTADTAGDYVIQLVVNDGKVDSAPDKVTIHASAANAAPNADAGSDRGVSVSDTVALDGSDSSDPNGDALTYAWQLVSVPQGSGARLEDAKTAKPSFVADAVGAYVAELTVTDSHGASDHDRVVITAGPTLQVQADLGNTGSFEPAALPYDQTLAKTVIHAPYTSANQYNGFVLGKFKVKAVGGDITLNTSFNIDNTTDRYYLAFDGFQNYSTVRQVVVPKGKTLEFTVNVSIPQDSRATISYLFNVVETGDSFKATYHVQSSDYQN